LFKEEKMTLQEAVNIVWRRVEKSTDYPDSSSEDFELIQGDLNDAIEVWGNKGGEANIKWRELYKNLEDSSDGDKETVIGQSAYETPSDFSEMSSWVKVGDILLPYVKSGDVTRRIEQNASDRFYYMTKADGKWIVNINPTPDSVMDISYSYYKEPLLLTNTTDVFEMGKPYFAIYLAIVSRVEDESPDIAQVYSSKAASVFNTMVIDNEIVPENHSFKLEDLGNKLKGEAFGI
jgi:hypothetical protein